MKLKTSDFKLFQSKISRRKELGVLIALLILIIFFALTSDVFFKTKNIVNILRQVSLQGIMAMGMTMVIVSGEFDLSVGSVFGMAGMFAGTLMQLGLPIWLAVILGLLLGLIIGMFSGVLVSYGRIPSFIVTLGMLNIVRGSALIITGGLVVELTARKVRDFANLDTFFYYMGGGKIAGELPIMIVYFLVVALAAYLFFHKTIMGFRMRAVGGNPSASTVAGINVNIVKICAFAILGFLSALAGIINLAFLHNVQGTTGQGMELNVIAATIIGGTSISGGEGTILGTIIGVLIMGVLNNGLILIGVSSFVQTVCIGAVIIGSVAIDMWTKKKNA